MTTFETDLATAHASKYLQQLCKHWSHKMSVEFDAQSGLVPFSAEARCRLRADADALHISVEAPDAPTGARLGQVVYDHLKRFAFREELPQLAWRSV
jgi:hypothetical protein